MFLACQELMQTLINVDSHIKFVKVRKLMQIKALNDLGVKWINVDRDPYGLRTKNLNTRYLSTISFVFL